MADNVISDELVVDRFLIRPCQHSVLVQVKEQHAVIVWDRCEGDDEPQCSDDD